MQDQPVCIEPAAIGEMFTEIGEKCMRYTLSAGERVPSVAGFLDNS
jgi:hypothetical protein